MFFVGIEASDINSYCHPCLFLGIEASDVSSLLAQFEEAADSAKNTQ